MFGKTLFVAQIGVTNENFVIHFFIMNILYKQYQIGRLELKKDLAAPFYSKLKQLLHHSYLYIVVINSTCII